MGIELKSAQLPTKAAAVAAILFFARVSSAQVASMPIDSAADSATAQVSFVRPAPPPPDERTMCGQPLNEIRARRAAVAATFVGANAYLYSYFKKAWWSGEKADHFFFHADWDQDFRDQDKFGHMFGGYHLARIGDAMLKSTCTSKKKAVIWSAAYAAAFQLQIEIWDGLYKKYGFSYADLLANSTGTALAVLHETHPRTRAIKPTISYWPSKAERNADNLPPGSEIRPSLDYSGQTYWFSADVNAVLPDRAKPFWPGFLRVSAGQSITDWIDPVTGASKRAKRKLLLSIDFDAEKLPGNNRVWKTVKRQLGYIHLPSPALQITPDTKFIGWYK